VENMIRLRETMRRSPMVVGDSGVTIIELMIASVILFIAAIGVMAALSFSASASAQSDQRTKALDLATKRLELARSIPYDDVGIDGGNPEGDFLAVDPAPGSPARPDGFTITTEVEWSRDASSGAAEYKNVVITVSWTVPRPGRVSLSSAIYGTTLMTNVSDLRVFAREKLTSNPIHMARVSIVPASRTAQIIKFTNTTGEAFYGRIPIGVVKQATVSATGWVFEPFDLPVITPSVVTYLWANARRPASAIVTVIDTSGTPIPNAWVTLTGTSPPAVTSRTGIDGAAHFSGLFPYPDAYTISATAPGRTPVGSFIGPMVDGGSYDATVTMMPPLPPGALRVIVKDVPGALLANAVVYVTGPSPDTSEVAGSPMTTGSGGEVVYPGLETGTYEIRAQRDSYVDAVTSIAVNSGVEALVTIKLSADVDTGDLDIEVAMDAAGTPNVGHAVSWWAGSGTSGNALGTGVTGADGHLLLTGLPVGTYTVRVPRSSSSYRTNYPIVLHDLTVFTRFETSY
jgi:hypothetical protein